jgi:hypothetical protein
LNMSESESEYIAFEHSAHLGLAFNDIIHFDLPLALWQTELLLE